MIYQFLENLEKNKLKDIAGMEALGIGEKTGLFFSELSLSIDKAFAKLKTSAHVVNYDQVSKVVGLNNPNFFKHASDQLPTPAFFSKDAMSFEDYCKGVNLAPVFLSEMNTEIARFYSWLKEVASKGVIGHTYRFSISSTTQMVFDVESFIGSLKEHKNSTAHFNDMYSSFNDVFNTIQQFNSAVSTVKSRDIEVLAKNLDMVSKIGNLIVEKIKASEIVLDEQSMGKIQTLFTEFSNYANYLGVMLGLMNEQTRVFEEQLSDIKKMK